MGRRYRPTLHEHETIIRWDLAERIVHIWSSQPAVWRRLERLDVSIRRSSTSHGVETGRWYTLPLDQFRWGLKRQGTGKGNPTALQIARRRRAGLV
jgi:hypothetical protein